ncbi:MAG: hypothetical protein V3T60_01340, partial [Candidatus Binatia bacterium]
AAFVQLGISTWLQEPQSPIRARLTLAPPGTEILDRDSHSARKLDKRRSTSSRRFRSNDP